MATTTLATIMARWRAVLEAAPLNLQATVEPFSDETQPTTLVDNAYRIVSGGRINSKALGNRQWALMDRLSVHVTRKMGMDGQAAQEALLDLMDDIEAALLNDGDGDNNYQATVEKGSRKLSRP